MAAAVANEELFRHSDERVETWKIPATAKNTLVLQAGGRVGVTLTDTTGITKSVEYKPYTVSGIPTEGASNWKADESPSLRAVGVATDGTWTFPGVVQTIAGAAATPTSTAQGTKVYATSGAVLTLESSGNTYVGFVNYSALFTKAAGVLPIKIGS
jgi:hypothetical protein